MLYRDNLINNMHEVYREDLWLKEIFESGGITLSDIQNAMELLEKNYWFDSITLEFLPIYERILKIKTNPLSSLEDRRSLIEAKWKSGGKCDLKLIQAVCKSWQNGNVAVNFIEGKIQLKFNGAYGVPTDLLSLISLVEDIKPAHLMLSYIFAYLLIKNINAMTVTELQTKKIKEFAFNAM